MASSQLQPCHAHWSTALHRKGLEALHPSGLSGVSGEPCRIWRIDIAECHRFRHAPDTIRPRSPAYDRRNILAAGDFVPALSVHV
jgi:hypothetical protein